MSLLPIYSRRKRQLEPASDVYLYDILPNKLRVQFIQIMDEALGEFSFDNFEGNEAWAALVDMLRKELGTFQLARAGNRRDEFVAWFLGTTNIDELLDAVEFGCRIIDTAIRNDNLHFSANADKLLSELNARFQEAGVGYQYVSHEIIRVDSQLLHKEVVLPALQLLSDSKFAGANSEFLEAHRQFRAGDYEQCLTECCKAFESVLKVIAKAEGWAVSQTDPVSKLLKSAFDAGLIPPYLQSEFDGLKAVLQAGIPTVRNKTSGHGTGAIPRVVPQHLAAFQLHQTAAAIVFIVEAYRGTP